MLFFLFSLRPFSRSRFKCSGLIRGVGGTSSKSFLLRPFRLLLPLPPSLTDLGNSLRRGVRAVTTFLADLRIVSRTVHSRFLATKKRTPLRTVVVGVSFCFVLVWGGYALPMRATRTTTTMMAIRPPREIPTLELLVPEAPAALPSWEGPEPGSPAPTSAPAKSPVARGKAWMVVVAIFLFCIYPPL